MFTRIRNSFFSTITIALFTVSFILTSEAQTHSMFPLLTTGDYGYEGKPIEYGDSLFFLYRTNTQRLAKFNGSSYRLLPPMPNISGDPIVYNGNLYYRFSSNKIGRINNDGTATVFNKPDAGFGLMSLLTIYNGKLYGEYYNSLTQLCVAVFDGNTMSLLPRPDYGPGYTWSPLVHGGYLYWVYEDIDGRYNLGRYNGSSFDLIINPDNGIGITSQIIAMGDKIYFGYNDSLGIYDGNNITVLPLPQNAAMHSDPVVHEQRIWFRTLRSTQQYQLAYYDGDSVSLYGDTYNYEFGFRNPVSFKGNLYFQFDSLVYSPRLARVDLNNLTFLSGEPGLSITSMQPQPTEHNKNLYYRGHLPDNSSVYVKFDGNNFIAISPPPGGKDANSIAVPVIYKGSLYYGYTPILPEQGSRLTRLTDSLLNADVCVNSNLTIRSNLVGSVYQWQVSTGTGFSNISNNAIYSGTNTNSLNIISLPGTAYGFDYRCMVNGNPGQLSKIRFTNIWTGAVNNNWYNAANWSCGTVPELNTDVIINSGNVLINSSTIVRSLHLGQHVSLTIGTGVNFTVLY